MTPRMREFIRALLAERQVDPDLRTRATKVMNIINYGAAPSVGQGIIRELRACPYKEAQ